MRTPKPCGGTGRKPKRGVCPVCGGKPRLRDGKMRGHYRPEDAAAIRREVWSLFR